MINQLIADYENILCTEEMNLVVGFYNTVGDFDAAMVLCEKLSAEGYGKSLNKANKSSTAAVSEYISKYQIADITGTSVEYIESLPLIFRTNCWTAMNLTQTTKIFLKYLI